MQEEKTIVKYEARDGQEIKLSFSAVKKYLVQGNSQAVTEQELMYFLGVCKSRGLNPFKKDAYLIKYGNDPAAIIISIDYCLSTSIYYFRGSPSGPPWSACLWTSTRIGAVSVMPLFTDHWPPDVRSIPGGPIRALSTSRCLARRR